MLWLIPRQLLSATSSTSAIGRTPLLVCPAVSGLRALRSGGADSLVQGPGPFTVPPPVGATWTVFDEPVNPTASAPGVAMDVGSSVWAASVPSTSAPEEKGWAKFTDFQPFCW